MHKIKLIDESFKLDFLASLLQLMVGQLIKKAKSNHVRVVSIKDLFHPIL